MQERDANVDSTISTADNTQHMDDGLGLCADISARDEVVPQPWQERRAGAVRALGEELGSQMGVIFAELKRLQDKVEELQNAAPDPFSFDKLEEHFDERYVKLDDFDPDNFDPDDYPTHYDVEEKVKEELRSATFEVKVEV